MATFTLPSVIANMRRRPERDANVVDLTPVPELETLDTLAEAINAENLTIATRTADVRGLQREIGEARTRRWRLQQRFMEIAGEVGVFEGTGEKDT